MPEEFIEKENKKNRIPFDQMRYLGEYYELSYDPEKKNIGAPSIGTKLFYIKVPPLKELDRLGMDHKYGKGTYDKSDCDYITDYLLKKSGDGLDKIVRMNGEHYKVTEEGKILAAVNPLMEDISIDDFIAKYIYDENTVFYDLLKEPLQIEYDFPGSFPQFVVKLDLPDFIIDESLIATPGLIIDRSKVADDSISNRPTEADLSQFRKMITTSWFLQEILRDERINYAQSIGVGINPTYRLHETEFYVDVDNYRLKQVANPENSISFRDMVYWDDCYEIKYDKSIKNVPSEFDYNPDNIVLLTVPHLTRLNPEAMALKYNLPLEKVQGLKDFDLMVDKDLYDLRMTGKQPIIKIHKEDFYVHLFARRLSHTKDITSHLELRDFSHSEEDGIYHGLYDTKNREVVKVDEVNGNRATRKCGFILNFQSVRS